MNDKNRLKLAVSDMQRHLRDTTGYAPPKEADFIDGPLTCEWCGTGSAVPGSDPPECHACQHLARVR